MSIISSIIEFFNSSYVTGVVSSLIATYIFLVWRKNRGNRHLKKILNFGGEDDLVFVFPHREHDLVNTSDVAKISILPRTSTEDFMAINNLKTALLTVNWENKDKIRDTHTFMNRAEEKKKNIISVCSRKTNEFTREIEEQILKNRDNFLRAEQITGENERWRLSDGRFPYLTKTYDQLDEYLKQGVSINEIPTKRFEDVAYITKITNPYNGRNKIFLIAGVRGIGTWGAAECIKKEFDQIYSRLPRGKKDCDFSALVIINYDNMDIVKIKVHHVIPFI